MTIPQESSPVWGVVQYVRILWKRRLLVGLGSVVPALVFAGLMHFQARSYRVSYAYERPLTENDYGVLSRRFYSFENLQKISSRLREKGLASYAERLDNAQTEKSVQGLIGLRVYPPFPRRSGNTDPVTSARISAFLSQLLYIEISGSSRQEVEAVSAVVADDVENAVPLYSARASLNDAVRQASTQMAEIEETRFTTSLDLERERARLTQLQATDDPSTRNGATVPQDGLTLQVNADPNNRDLLPWSYQMRSARAKIIDLEQSLKTNEAKYEYYLKVIELDNQLARIIDEKLPTFYTLQQYIDLLKGRLDQSKDRAVVDCLRSYASRAQNMSLRNARVGEKPVVYAVAGYTTQSVAVAFIVLWMVTSFIAVALESRNGWSKQP
jgi:hypothetical protein